MRAIVHWDGGPMKVMGIVEAQWTYHQKVMIPSVAGGSRAMAVLILVHDTFHLDTPPP